MHFGAKATATATQSLSGLPAYFFLGAAGAGNAGLSWLLTDHLGSSMLTAEGSNGTKLTKYRYKAWGETRYASGRFPINNAFTGQYFDNDMGLYYYGARWYDSALGRFAQADTIVPDTYNPIDFDRYANIRNNPVRYTDPTGHCIWDLCIIEGFGLVELALVTGGGAVALYASTPTGREATTQIITEGLDWVTEQILNSLDRIRTLVKSTAPKPLIPDEQGHVDKLNKGIDDFLSEHPDLAEEAERVAEGETLPPGKDHVTEANNFARGLENSIEYLQNVRDKRTAEAQKAIDQVIENAQKQLDKLHEILGE